MGEAVQVILRLRRPVTRSCGVCGWAPARPRLLGTFDKRRIYGMRCVAHNNVPARTGEPITIEKGPLERLRDLATKALGRSSLPRAADVQQTPGLGRTVVVLQLQFRFMGSPLTICDWCQESPAADCWRPDQADPKVWIKTRLCLQHFHKARARVEAPQNAVLEAWDPEHRAYECRVEEP